MAVAGIKKPGLKPGLPLLSIQEAAQLTRTARMF